MRVSKDSQLVAITGGRASLESAYLRAQLDIGLAEGVVYVGGGGIDDSIDGVIIAYGPDQSTKQECVSVCSERKPSDHSPIESRLIGRLRLDLSLFSPLKCNNGGTIMSVNIHLLLTILVLNNVTLFQVQPKYSELTSLALGDSDVRRGSWYIRLLAVHPDSQRRGLARRLLEVFKTKVFIPWYSKSVACIHIPLTLH